MLKMNVLENCSWRKIPNIGMKVRKVDK